VLFIFYAQAKSLNAPLARSSNGADLNWFYFWTYVLLATASGYHLRAAKTGHPATARV
jgi:hypothetical protein